MFDKDNDITCLFHRLNNQLGVILANAELLESRLADTTHRPRAEQVVIGALDAITTVRRIKNKMEPPGAEDPIMGTRIVSQD